MHREQVYNLLNIEKILKVTSSSGIYKTINHSGSYV